MQYEDLSKASTGKMVKITCDFKISEKCRGTYFARCADVRISNEKNNGKDICIACSRRLPSKIEIGTKYGRLTVISRDFKSKKWICNCECGNQTKSRSDALKRGTVKSCGCGIKGPKLERRLPNNLSLWKDVIRVYKQGAKSRNYDWELSEEEAIQMMTKNCHYCNSEPSNKLTYRFGPDRFIMYTGLDRVDNNLGYIQNNVVPCCKICNHSKLDLSLEEWTSWIKKVYENMEMLNDRRKNADN